MAMLKQMRKQKEIQINNPKNLNIAAPLSPISISSEVCYLTIPIHVQPLMPPIQINNPKNLNIAAPLSPISISIEVCYLTIPIHVQPLMPPALSCCCQISSRPSKIISHRLCFTSHQRLIQKNAVPQHRCHI